MNLDVRTAESLGVFKRQLKTDLFQKYLDYRAQYFFLNSNKKQNLFPEFLDGDDVLIA